MARPTGTSAMQRYGINACDNQSAFYSEVCQKFRELGDLLCRQQVHNLRTRDGFERNCYVEVAYDHELPLTTRLSRVRRAH